MEFIKKLICRIFGHKWIYINETSNSVACGEPLTRSVCDRCDFDGGLW